MQEKQSGDEFKRVEDPLSGLPQSRASVNNKRKISKEEMTKSGRNMGFEFKEGFAGCNCCWRRQAASKYACLRLAEGIRLKDRRRHTVEIHIWGVDLKGQTRGF